MLIERILFPIDFSEASVNAAARAAALARHFHSQITLLHVNEFQVIHSLTGPLGFGIASPEAIRSEHMAGLRKQLEQFAAEELSGLQVRRILCSGDPAKVIVERACEDRSSLILMPTHGDGPFRRFLLGSVTAKVLHDSGVPVWTGAHMANARAEVPNKIRNVMCAVNFGPETAGAIHWAADLASEFGAQLTLAHVVLEIPPALPDRYAFHWHAEARSGAEERMRTLLLDAGLRAEVLVVSDGDVAGALANAVQEKSADLLVIGRSAVGDARRLGSHAYGILCYSPCPVVSI